MRAGQTSHGDPGSPRMWPGGVTTPVPPNLPEAAVTPRRLVDRVAEWLRRWRSPPPTAGIGAPNPSALLRDFESSALGGPGHGLDDITRLLDRWFDAEVRQLEGEARGCAQAWAAAGLPRARAAAEQLPVEVILALRRAEIRRTWS